MEINITNREQLINIFTDFIMRTPHEFIDFPSVEFELSDEYVVKGDETWQPGMDPKNVTMIPEGYILVRVPLRRKQTIYGYYAEMMDKQIEDAEAQLEELKRAKQLYKDLSEANVEE